jgi:AraC-like DNA-binding protein
MKKDNICIFNEYASSDLVCVNFVLETSAAQSVPIKADKYALQIVTQGAGVFSVGEERYDVERGDIFFVCRGDDFTVCGTDMEYCYVSFRGRRADEYAERFGIKNGRRIFRGSDELISFWLRSISLADAQNTDLVSEAVLLYTLANLPVEKKEHSDVVSKVVAFINENFSDASLSLSTVARKLGYNSKYLSTLFKNQMGMSYTEFLRNVRIKHAIFLIEQGVSSVKNIAILSGFSDPLYFSKVFAASEGMSPKAYVRKISDAER